MDIKELNQELGNTDLLLIDQILKNRFTKDMHILDAGCGEGRNMTYFIRNGYNIQGIDKNADAIRMARLVARSLNKEFNTENIKSISIENNSFSDNQFDSIMCINVLHFSKDKVSFYNTIQQMLRITKQDGFLFLAMETNIGMGKQIRKSDNGQYELPNGEIRFLLTEKIMKKLKRRFNLMEIEEPRILALGKYKRHIYLILSRNNI